jgi:hypothetical protein
MEELVVNRCQSDIFVINQFYERKHLEFGGSTDVPR